MKHEIGDTIITASGRYTIANILEPAGDIGLFVAYHAPNEANPTGWFDLIAEDTATAWPLGDSDDRERNAMQFAALGGGKEGDDSAALAEAVRVGSFHVVSQCSTIEETDKKLSDWILERASEAGDWAYETPETFAPTVSKSEDGEAEVSWPEVRVLREAAENDPAEIVERTVAAFRGLGAEVSEEAVRHNLDAWLRDEKSGFRDEKNGVHLFSPCGCNPLRFWVSRLSDEGRGYQNTYAV